MLSSWRQSGWSRCTASPSTALLLKLGPGFYDAARTVFKQVLKEYPDSARAKEARQQLEAIGGG